MTIRREPALLWVGFVAPVLQALVAFLLVDDPTVQALVNAAVVAAAGAITAFLVRADNLVPAITGAVQAVIALLVGLGFDWSPELQSALMVAVGAVAAFVVRDRVVAPVPAPTVNA